MGSGNNLEIKPYHLDHSQNPLEALYKNGIQEMWPGPVVTLRQVERDISRGRNRVILSAGQMFYPYIAALKDPEIIKLYKQAGIEIPDPALGICTPVKTADGRLALTMRDAKRTRIYPGRIHSPGGQPLLVDTNVQKHQEDEVGEELRIKRSELIGKFLFTGIVLDQEFFPNKPDLTGFATTILDAGDIRERVLKVDSAQRPPDVIGVVFAPASEDGLFKYMTEYTHPVNFCPPTVGSLWLYGRFMYGQDWGNEVLKRMGLN